MELVTDASYTVPIEVLEFAVPCVLRDARGHRRDLVTTGHTQSLRSWLLVPGLLRDARRAS